MSNSSKKSEAIKLLSESKSVKEVAEILNTNIAYVYKIKKELELIEKLNSYDAQ